MIVLFKGFGRVTGFTEHNHLTYKWLQFTSIHYHSTICYITTTLVFHLFVNREQLCVVTF
jgi:hypothetical protein